MDRHMLGRVQVSGSKLVRLLAVLVGSLTLFVACGDSDSSNTAQLAASDGSLPDLGGREVTIAVENQYLPFNYIDAETGEPAGWDYAAIDEMCSRLNCVPKYEAFAWEGMIQAVSDGQFDMAADGITITADRAEIVDFSTGYINIDQRIMVRLDEDRFSDSDGLAADGSLTIGTQTGTTNYDTAVTIVGADRIVAYESFPFAVQALIAGDVDAVVIDETAGQGYVGANANEVKLVGRSLSSDELGFIFTKGSDLVAAFDAAINAMKADGTMAALGQEYFSGAFTITYDNISDVEYTQ